MITTVGPKWGTVGIQLIHGGKCLTKHAHNEETFIAAPESGSYLIRLTNNSNVRKLVVISVDGRNVMDGKSAGLDGQGYVLSAGQTSDIKGWRRTDQEVAAFDFVDIQASYEVKMGGSGSNVGVIGVAVFEEKPKYQYWSKGITIGNSLEGLYGVAGGTVYDTQADSITLNGSLGLDQPIARGTTESLGRQTLGGSSGGMRRRTKSSTKGTGYGKKTAMQTTSTTFEKASTVPSQIIALRYASQPTLKKWGVIKDPVIPVVNPFPEEESATTAPPGWNG